MMTLLTTDVAKNHCHIFSERNTEIKTMKYAYKWTSVTNPSILSKLLQKLAMRFIPNKSAKKIIPIKTLMAIKSGLFLGRKDLSLIARIIHNPRIISTINRKAKALPVMKGKYRLPVITKGINRDANKPIIIVQRRVLFIKINISESGEPVFMIVFQHGQKYRVIMLDYALPLRKSFLSLLHARAFILIIPLQKTLETPSF